MTTVSRGAGVCCKAIVRVGRIKDVRNLKASFLDVGQVAETYVVWRVLEAGP